MKNITLRRRIMSVIAICVFVITLCVPSCACTSKDKQMEEYNKVLVARVCHRYGKEPKIIYHMSWKTRTHRVGKKYIYVEKMYSYSTGKKYGYTDEGEYVAYNKKVKRGKRVTTYIVYNPENNYWDDAVAVVDNGMYR